MDAYSQNLLNDLRRRSYNNIGNITPEEAANLARLEVEYQRDQGEMYKRIAMRATQPMNDGQAYLFILIFLIAIVVAFVQKAIEIVPVLIDGTIIQHPFISIINIASACILFLRKNKFITKSIVKAASFFIITTIITGSSVYVANENYIYHNDLYRQKIVKKIIYAFCDQSRIETFELLELSNKYYYLKQEVTDPQKLKKLAYAYRQERDVLEKKVFQTSRLRAWMVSTVPPIAEFVDNETPNLPVYGAGVLLSSMVWFLFHRRKLNPC